MALNKEIEQAFNKQINAEMYSAYLYLSMSTWFEDISLKGFAHWMRCQYLEETMHAMKMFNFVCERGGRVTLDAIEKPETDWESSLKVIEQVAKHEAHVTNLINKLTALAREKTDFASESFLMWFIDEQVEEEASADEILSRLKMIGNDANALFTLDNELKGRAEPAAALDAILDRSPGN